jgi:2'-5' RNA ligase
VIDEFSAVSAQLRSGGDGLRWMTRESWHITLQFLGNTGPEQYESLVARLRELRLPAVPIEIERLGLIDRAGIVIAAVRPAPELLLLQERITAATRRCGFIPEARPYQPHITLARGKGPRQSLDALKAKISRQAKFTRSAAKEFVLYESFLSSAGSRYEIRERFALDGRLETGGTA